MTGEIVLDKWQKEALEWEGNLLLCTGRQVGKTMIMAQKAATRMMDRPTRIIIVSLTEDQAKLIIIMILDYLEKHGKNDIAKGRRKPTQNKIILKNGSSAIARPVGNTGDAVRGFTGDILIIDEASRMPDLVWAAGRPVLLTTAGNIWMCSTPFGKKGYFWEAFQNKNQKYKVIHVTSEEVVRDREISESWTETSRTGAIKFLENERADMTELQYGQEYLGLFLDDLRQFFSDELIAKTCVIKRPARMNTCVAEHPNSEARNYLGVDIARMGEDETTYEIIREINDNYFVHVESVVKKKSLTTETEQNIIDMSKMWNCRKIGIDAGAGTLGVSVLDHLLQTEVRNKVIALNNRSISMDSNEEKKQHLLKEDMYQNLKSMMEKKEIKLLDDDALILSAKSIQYEFTDTPSGTRVRIFGSYSHIIEGIIRAAWLAKKEKSLNLWAA